MAHTIECIAVAIGLLLLGGCAGNGYVPQSERVDASTAAAQVAKQGNDDDVVCFQRHTTGSHLAHVVCVTRKQRMANQKKSREALEKMQKGGQTGVH